MVVELPLLAADATPVPLKVVDDLPEPEFLPLKRIERLEWDAREQLLEKIARCIKRADMLTQDISAPQIEMLMEVKNAILECLESVGQTEGDLQHSAILLEELLLDAAKHGSRMQPEKNVHVTYGQDDDHIGVLIADDGEGFDIDRIPNPLHPDNLEKPGGRGILLSDDFLQEHHLNGFAYYLPTSPETVLCNAVYIRFPDKRMSETKLM